MFCNQLVSVKMASEFHHLIDPQLIPVQDSPKSKTQRNTSNDSDRIIKERDHSKSSQHSHREEDSIRKRDDSRSSHHSRDKMDKRARSSRRDRSGSSQRTKHDSSRRRHRHRDRRDRSGEKRDRSRSRHRSNKENVDTNSARSGHHGGRSTSFIKKREQSRSDQRCDDFKNSSSSGSKSFKRETSRERAPSFIKKEQISFYKVLKENSQNLSNDALDSKPEQRFRTKSNELSKPSPLCTQTFNRRDTSPFKPKMFNDQVIQSTVIRSPSPKTRIERYTKDNGNDSWSSESPSPFKNSILKDESFEQEVGNIQT